ncbi:MAG: hypothetical protein JRN21_04865 [Nitrososphaerota archaeon]|nr:hypothetical protein [Nitrososphaerota archaeon]
MTAQSKPGGGTDAHPELSRFTFVLDEGGVFKAPMEKIWRLHSSPEHVHPSDPDAVFERAGEGVTYIRATLTLKDGTRVKNEMKLTAYPPLGFSFEWLEGLFAGSKEFSFYLPQGGETGVTSVGEWTSPTLSPEQVKPAVLQVMETLYEEDQANLARMK